MNVIYHITTKTEWNEALNKGYYTAPSLQTEGFIHCSKAEQIKGVLERYFKEKNNLVKLVINVSALEHKLQYDFSPSVNETFPHIYGIINLNAVVTVVDL
ncbi:MAG: DUF952 domain-containing protein [Bacteroidetes bacterium]|nr:DUF952 domain-containing protein [Bacteroidota bacterium]MBS1642833.1 DUF952 domain-containing protein [Bacteroidota bacterium]